jgi:trehalose synthase
VQAAVCIQKSIREGFGLTVSEALWKSRPTIGGRVGGIVAQISDGETGYLVDSPEECAKRTLDILADPGATRDMTRRAKEHVRRKFLMPRLLRDWLALMHRMAGETTVELEVVAGD